MQTEGNKDFKEINKDNVYNPDPINNKAKIALIMKQSKENLLIYLGQYLENPYSRNDNKTKEFEIRFGTNPRSGRPITKIDYDNVVKQSIALGFTTKNKEGFQSLRMEYTDGRTGVNKFSRIRAEVEGVNLIEEYCRTNSLQKLVNIPTRQRNSVIFTQKTSTLDKDGKFQRPIDFPDMNFRASYQLERVFKETDGLARNIIDNWSDYKKKYRCINRVRFQHPEYPVFLDLSIVRSSKKINDYVDYPTYTIQEANVFNNAETYEIELEIDNSRVGPGTAFTTPELLLVDLRKCIRMVMSGIQGSNYPIAFSERDQVLESYMRLLFGEEESKKLKVGTRYFIGPDSKSLQLENIGELEEGSLVPNIRTNYTVTEKADGERRLLYVNSEGLIYMIDKNMNVTFTGTKTTEKTLLDSIFDGEHIKYDKFGKFINLYAAFDIYFLHGKNIRDRAFIPSARGELKENYRLPLLYSAISNLKPLSVIKENNTVWKEVKNEKTGEIRWFDLRSGKYSLSKPVESNPACGLRVQCKEFYSVDENRSIFDGCSEILSKEELFEYNTDGLIFTPANTGVASSVSTPLQSGPLKKMTWDLSFKWKPAEFNTVDFLVTLVKDKSGKDKIQNLFQEGKNTQGLNTIIQYKTLELRCGYDTAKYISENPFNDLIHGKFPDYKESDDTSRTYEPKPFQPTTPYDPEACLCNIVLKEDGNMFTTDTNEYFEESMIVEFKYDKNAAPKWRWNPIRVRYDKTQKLRNGRDREYGNDYFTANSNWHSIHYEVTRDMIMTGEGIPEITDEKDVYYNSSKQDSKTMALRNFHNLYVKRKLIMGVSNQNDTLIDYAVGMGGDIEKWYNARLSFVFGIDISEDNINNPLNGACARYLGKMRTTRNLFKGLFVKGDSGLNIRSTYEAFSKDSPDKKVARAVFGKGEKDEITLGKSVYNLYGKGEDGFNVSSCQFAIHYFFQNPRLLHGFMRNLQECTRVQGYFIGTCYDGKTIFDLLSSKPRDEGIAIMTDMLDGRKKKICEITKKYDETGFPDDDNSIGYKIEVFQETINKSFPEYLVNFNYLKRIMEVYGFTLITNEEARQMGLPNASGMFEELFSSMENEVKRNVKKRDDYKEALEMSSGEKTISFWNRYFVFRKVTNVDASKLTKLFMSASVDADFDAENPSDLALLEEEVQKYERSIPPVRGDIKKIKARIVLNKKTSSILDGPSIESESDEEDDTPLNLNIGPSVSDSNESDSDKE